MIKGIFKRKETCFILISIMILSGCVSGVNRQTVTTEKGKIERISSGTEGILRETEELLQSEKGRTDEGKEKLLQDPGEALQGPEEISQKSSEILWRMEDTSIEDRVSEPEIIEVDWSEYFDGLQGTDVLYEAKDRRFANLVSGISGRLLIRSDRNKCKKPWRSYLMGTVIFQTGRRSMFMTQKGSKTERKSKIRIMS